MAVHWMDYKYISFFIICLGTNINDAVLLAVDMLHVAEKTNIVPENSASMIILLTDGDPNVGMSVLLISNFEKK